MTMAALADWRNGSNYPATDGTVLLSRWHWEFLRRNREYQKDYETFKSLPNDYEGLPQREALARKYGLEGIMFDYTETMEELFRSPRDPAKIRTIQWQTEWEENYDGTMVEVQRKDMEYLDPKIRQHEYGVIFNLRHPVDLQLETARKFLQREASRHHEKRGRIENYPLYLRLIDADADNASLDEIAETLYPDVDRRIARKKIEEELKTARKLRDVNYRYI